MARSTEVLSSAAGPLVVKRATGDDVAHLLAEARRLEAASHPGVVELRASVETTDGWELRLAHGGRPLGLAGPLPVTEVAGLAAGIAATLADLHDSGIVHGRIDASHVLIGAHGRAVLCGLGADPVGATPADDVKALGTLLASLLDAVVEIEPIPDRRWSIRRPGTGWERRSLLLLADHACAEPPSRRPTAGRLAAAIADAVPGAGAMRSKASSPSPTTMALSRRRPPRRADHAVTRRPRSVALAAATAVVVLLGIFTVRVGRPDVRSATAMTTPAPNEMPSSTAPVPEPTTVLPTTTTTTVVPVRADGTTMVVGDQHFRVGQAGDLVVLGDWDCAGGPTPAVLRPSTGEVFLFMAWPAVDAVTVRPAATVPGAATAHVVPGTDGCSTLVVRRDDGARVPVPTRRTA